MTRVDKAWGHEIIFANSGDYCGKRMALKAGFRSSVHRHATKTETFYVESGVMALETGDPASPEGMAAVVMRPGSAATVTNGTWHRFTGLADTVFFEVSTHDDPKDNERLTSSGEVPPEELQRLVGM